MKKWITEFRAIDPRTGDLKLWCGPEIEAPTAELAQEWCYNNLGHLVVVGELKGDIPCKNGTHDPDWSKHIDYDNIQNN